MFYHRHRPSPISTSTYTHRLGTSSAPLTDTFGLNTFINPLNPSTTDNDISIFYQSPLFTPSELPAPLSTPPTNYIQHRHQFSKEWRKLSPCRCVVNVRHQNSTQPEPENYQDSSKT